MSRVYNFSAGPSMLPEACSAKGRSRKCWIIRAAGQSVMEMSHRSKVYDGIIKELRGPAARSDGHSGQLQGAVSAGRCVLPVRHGAR